MYVNCHFSQHGHTQISEGELWINFMISVADRANEGLQQSTDFLPGVIILNQGDSRFG